ncbi:MAG: monovalent cation/H+ antiporter subunit D family protein [Gemmatimonadetes bacterium]|nr:monovalent cation/H+ antiporter subunit D family protein [Gemmatimonadota bacterium]
MSAEGLVLLALAIPSVGAILIALAGRHPNLREAVTLLTSGLLLLAVGWLTGDVLAGARPRVTLVEMIPGLRLQLAVEPLGMIFGAVASLLWPLNSLYSIGYMRGNREAHQTRYYICFAIALASAMGVAFAGNLVTLFVFYEGLTLATYPLVTHHGTEAAIRAGRTYLGILLTTSVGLLLVAIIWTWLAAGTVDFRPGGILAGKMPGRDLGILLLLFVFGVGKAAVMPVHRWLPAAMVAPTPVSALLHAVAVVKAGVFTVVKVLLYIFGLDLLWAEPATHWLFYVAGFTVVGASVVALRILQRRGDLKRLLAYSTVSQLSYVILATAILAPISAMGAALHIVAHAFAKITLFFAAGSIYTAAHKTQIRELDGIGRRMPWTMGAFAVGALSLIGLPPTAGFVSKWYMLVGAFEARHLLAAAVLAVSTLLNAAYFAPIVYAAFFRGETAAPEHGAAQAAHGAHGADGGAGNRGGPPHGVPFHEHGEAPWPVVAATVATAALTLLLFFFPDLPLALADQMVSGILGGSR